MRPAVLFLSILFPAFLCSCSEHKPAKPVAAATAVVAAASAPAMPAEAEPEPESVPTPPAPPTPEQVAAAAAVRARAELMQAVFGKAFRPETSDGLMELNTPDDPEVRIYAVQGLAHTFLANGDAVLVANGALADGNGRAEYTHASSGLLNVFILRKTDGKWDLIKHHENIAALGSGASIGEPKFVDLAPGKPGLAMLHGGVWQGYTITHLSLFDLGADTLRDLTGDAIAVSSGNLDGCDPEGETTCWTIAADWHFAPSAPKAGYNDLVFIFSGEETRKKRPTKGGAASGAWESVTHQVNGAARYAYDGKTYVLVVGANPVPGV